jgi:hypothetical protein
MMGAMGAMGAMMLVSGALTFGGRGMISLSALLLEGQ